jgi:hypothetical protein
MKTMRLDSAMKTMRLDTAVKTLRFVERIESASRNLGEKEKEKKVRVETQGCQIFLWSKRTKIG